MQVTLLVSAKKFSNPIGELMKEASKARAQKCKVSVTERVRLLWVEKIKCRDCGKLYTVSEAAVWVSYLFASTLFIPTTIYSVIKFDLGLFAGGCIVSVLVYCSIILLWPLKLSR
jgi:hypothetical protein